MIVLDRSKDQDKMFADHATQDPIWDVDRKHNKGLSNWELMRLFGARLICPKCERVAFRHKKKDMAFCPKCGWHGRSITVDEYLNEKTNRR